MKEVNTTYRLITLVFKNLFRNKQILYSVEKCLLHVCAEYTNTGTGMLFQ
jgi:hypothetical protein